MKRTFLTGSPNYYVPSRSSRILFFDWPGQPASYYSLYCEALEEVGLGTSLQEMIGWLFSGFDLFGPHFEAIPDFVSSLYVSIEPRLPKHHDPDHVYELLFELMSVLHTDFVHLYGLIRPNALRIEIGPVTVFGIYLRVIERKGR